MMSTLRLKAAIYYPPLISGEGDREAVVGLKAAQLLRCITVYPVGDIVWIAKCISHRYPHDIKAMLLQVSVSFYITLRRITQVMSPTINFDDQLYLRAIKIENITTIRILAAKDRAVWVTRFNASPD